MTASFRKNLLLTAALTALLPGLSLSSQMPAVPTAPATKPLGSIAARTPPPWLESSVIYEVNMHAFSPEGNFNGVTKRLDALQKLGANVLWLMPLHPVGQVQKKGTDGSPYSVRDYYAVDPSYGTKDDLHRLIQEAHRRNMKVILDIVANHTAWDSVMMAHPAFYKHNAEGKIIYPYNWTDVAALDYSNHDLRRYMTDMLLYWAKDFDVDGFRCDAAGEVPTDFWEDARKELDHFKPGLLLLAEASKPELLRNAFDMDYSWPLMATLNNIIEHGAAASSIETTLEHEETLFPKHALHMRMIDDHDEQRALARYGIPGSLAASALVFTIDGIPMLYNGMEVGDSTESGAPALFEGLKIFWQSGEMRPEFSRFYNFIMPLRAQHAALRSGDLIWLHNSDESHVVSFLRSSKDEEFLITINLSNTPFRGTVEMAPGAWKEISMPTSRRRQTGVDEDGAPRKDAQVGLPALSLAAFQFRIFQKTSTMAAVKAE
jgi:cyclomaltodextrinase